MADGYLDLEDDDDWDQSDDELRKQEGNCLARVNMKAARKSTRPKDPPSSAHLITNQELHREWSGVTIDTTEDYNTGATSSCWGTSTTSTRNTKSRVQFGPLESPSW